VSSRDTTNAVCHAIEAALLHGLKGSSVDKVCFSGMVILVRNIEIATSGVILQQIDNYT